jgi:REP element-mobilizing transposase RayT
LLYKNKYRIESTRLTGWDYSRPGFYFVTICTLNHQHFFGEIVNNEMILNEHGIIVKNEWDKTFEIRQQLDSDEYQIMPNHFHCIVHITNRNKHHLQISSTRTKIDTMSQTIHHPTVETPCYGVSGDTTEFSSIPVKTPCYGVSGNTSKFSSLPKETPQRGVSTGVQPNNSIKHWKPDVLGSIIGQFKTQVTKRIHKNGLFQFDWQDRFHDHVIRNNDELHRIRQYIKNNPKNWCTDKFNGLQISNTTREDSVVYNYERWMV